MCSDAQREQILSNAPLASGVREHRITLNDPFHDPSDPVLLAPVQKISTNFREVGNVANVITDAIGGIVRVAHFVAQAFEDLNRLQNGQAVCPASP